ncbi:YpzI family protein [Alkalihalobacillus sp. R86527]
MGTNRQEKKIKRSKQVESDRDQSIEYRGSSTMEGPEQARKRNGQK